MNMPVDTLADPIAAHAKEMLAHLGEDPRRAGLRDTPQRFANALRFLTGGYEAEPRDVVGNGVFDAEGAPCAASMRTMRPSARKSFP